MFTLKFSEKNMENKEWVFLLEGEAIGGLWVPERLKGKPAKNKGMIKDQKCKVLKVLVIL